MFLKKFTLSDVDGNVIREVVFKKGMNIILGETTDDEGSSSNSLGKTTLIRCLDFCLGGKNLDDFFKDPELRSTNNIVNNFFSEKKPTFELILTKDFGSKDEIVIKRTTNINLRSSKFKNYINGGDPLSYNAFCLELKKILFNFDDEKPSYRSLLAKFIRGNDYRIDKILRFNHPTTSDAEYEKIHLFLLGFSSAVLLTQKSEVDSEIIRLEKIKSELNNKHSKSSLVQALYILNSEYTSLKEQVDSFKISETHDLEAQQLNEIQLELNSTTEQLSDLELINEFNLKRIEELNNRHLSKKTEDLKYLYQEAEYFNEKLNKNFDQLVKFHNTMLQNEIAYLREAIDSNNEKILTLKTAQIKLKEQYNELLEFLGRSGSLREYTKLNERLQKKSEEIGESNALLKERDYYLEKLDSLTKERDEINEKIEKEDNCIDENLRIFNKYFSINTEKLDSEKYILSYLKENNLYKFKVEPINSNPGSGLKHSIVIAFDLAYMAFSKELLLERPQFATSDKIEIIDIDKFKILIDLANAQDGQFIAPCIKDKIVSIFDSVKKNIILTLNENDKFFNIESSKVASKMTILLKDIDKKSKSKKINASLTEHYNDARRKAS